MFNQRLREELAAIDGEIKSEEMNQATTKFYKSTIPPWANLGVGKFLK